LSTSLKRTRKLIGQFLSNSFFHVWLFHHARPMLNHARNARRIDGVGFQPLRKRKQIRIGDSVGISQGCSTLFTESHGKDGFETAERCGVAVLGDRIGLVDPQDIVGEAAHSREDAGIFSDARRVFT